MSTNNWISVKDRLPESSGRYAAVFNGAVLFVAFETHGCRWFGLDSKIRLQPTHWQPLPEPPQKPDAFEEFCRVHEWQPNPDYICIPRLKESGCIDAIPKSSARTIWDAAIASTNEGK